MSATAIRTESFISLPFHTVTLHYTEDSAATASRVLQCAWAAEPTQWAVVLRGVDRLRRLPAPDVALWGGGGEARNCEPERD
jgi:hypothetical protein